jgi:hypothetical protein
VERCEHEYKKQQRQQEAYKPEQAVIVRATTTPSLERHRDHLP